VRKKPIPREQIRSLFTDLEWEGFKRQFGIARLRAKRFPIRGAALMKQIIEEAKRKNQNINGQDLLYLLEEEHKQRYGGSRNV